MIPHFGLKRQSKNLKNELLDATDRVLTSGQFLDGKYTREFESWLRQKTKTDYAVTVHSGTQALEIIAAYMKSIGPANIIIPNVSYPATLNAFLKHEYEIEIHDTDRYGILEDKNYFFSNNYCLVGLYGRKPWIDQPFEDSRNFIIDGAQHWLVAGNEIGMGMSISFDPTKNLPSTGNGGAIVTNNKDLYDYAVLMRNNGKPDFDFVGTNSKMSEQDCAQILVRTKYLDSWQQRREQIRQYYCNELREHVICLSDDSVPHANQKFVIYEPQNRNSLHTHMLTSGIDTKIHYDYTLGELDTAYKIVEKPYPVSTSYMLMRGVLSLPIYPELLDTEVEYIVDVIKKFYE